MAHHCSAFCIKLLVLVSLVWVAHPAFAGENSFSQNIQTASMELVKGLSGDKPAPKVSVYGINQLHTDKPWGITTNLENEIIKTLVSAGFVVFERSQLAKLNMERSFLVSGVRIGQSVGADYIVTGGYEVWNKDTLRVSLKLIEVQSGKIITATTIDTPTAEISSLLHEPTDTISLEAIQSKVRAQNQEIERLRKESYTSQQKQMLVKVIEEQAKTIGILKQRKDSGELRSRNYDENIAFVDLKSNPNDLDLYIDGNWAGKTPLGKLEVSSGVKHQFTLRGDPRYWEPLTYSVAYTKYQRTFDTQVMHLGQAQLILVNDEPIKRVFVNDCAVDFNPSKPVIHVFAGLNKIRIVGQSNVAVIKDEYWAGESIRLDIQPQHYVTDDALGFSILKSKYDETCAKLPTALANQLTDLPVEGEAEVGLFGQKTVLAGGAQDDGVEPIQGGQSNLTEPAEPASLEGDGAKSLIIQPTLLMGGPTFTFSPAVADAPQQIDTYASGLGVRLLHPSGVSGTLYSESGSFDSMGSDRCKMCPDGYAGLNGDVKESGFSVEYTWYYLGFGMPKQASGYVGLGGHSTEANLEYLKNDAIETARITTKGPDFVFGLDYLFTKVILGVYLRTGFSEDFTLITTDPDFTADKVESTGGGAYVGYQF